MNLDQFRQYFVLQSGRYDLVVDTVTFANNGANFFINAATRYLTQMTDNPKMNNLGRAFRTIPAGQDSVLFDEIQSVWSVWRRTETERILMTKISQDAMFYYFGDTLPMEIGAPRYWCDSTSLVTQGSDLPLGNHKEVADAILSDIRKIILIHPVPDISYQFEIWGRLYNDPDFPSQETYWTRHWPEVLYWATMYIMETHYRNSEGAQEWMRNITGWLKHFNEERTEEDLVDIFRTSFVF